MRSPDAEPPPGYTPGDLRTAAARGELDKAEENYLKSLAITEELGIKETSANQYGNLGNIYKTRGDLDKAEDYYRQSLAISEELGMKETSASIYGNLGNIYGT